jgi:hypothetical protein
MLVAGIVARSGPKIIGELHGRTVGVYHAHLGAIAANFLGAQQPNSESQSCR